MTMIKALTAARKSLDEHKAEEIKVIDVRSLTPFAEYYIIATAPNERALGAIAELVADDLMAKKVPVRKIDGTPESGWIIVDAGEVLIHLFLAETRQQVDLDSVLKHSAVALSH
jgi:ribosome-associated protein